MRPGKLSTLKRRIVLAGSAVALAGGSFVGLAAATAPAAHAAVISGGCPTAHYEVQTCVYETDSGQYIAQGIPLDAPHILQECLGFNGGAQFACTTYQSTPAGQAQQITATPPGGGSICAITWEADGDGTSTEVGDSCI